MCVCVSQELSNGTGCICDRSDSDPSQSWFDLGNLLELVFAVSCALNSWYFRSDVDVNLATDAAAKVT